MPIPSLETTRLILRPFTIADAPEVQRLAGAPEVADTTLDIPHPYLAGVAEEWIAGQEQFFEFGAGVNWAIILKSGMQLLGSISIGINIRHNRAEIGYWLGKPFWGQGYTTEAAGEVLRYCFTTRKLHKVIAHHFTRNPASGRVMQKIGMRYEGSLREHVRNGDTWEDMEAYGILAREWGK